MASPQPTLSLTPRNGGSGGELGGWLHALFFDSPAAIGFSRDGVDLEGASVQQRPDAVLGKPFTVEQLTEVLRQVSPSRPRP